MSTDARFWGVIPAAGIGRRMGGAVPKQYLLLGDRSILDHSLERLLDCPLVQGICVALAEADGWWPTCRGAVASRVFPVTGGAERAHSVLNALGYLEQIAAPSDWVLVHDAVRPCLRRSDIDKLIALLKDHPVGGILGVPVLDTVKQADLAGTVIATVPRERLWRAFTPQMFRLGPLKSALEGAMDRGDLVTDEASAMELAGYAPKLVEGQTDNIKITRPDDLALAAFYLHQQRT